MRGKLTTAAVLVLWSALVAADPPVPCEDLPCPADPSALDRVLAAAAEREWIDVVEIGRSAGGRPLMAAHLARFSETAPDWRLLLIGQQHGDEPAGKDALLQLIHRVAQDPEALPADVELWVVPSANPDGAAAGTRRNAADADLNRDYLVLAQPETRALHQLARDIRPHVVVDCHEFNRSSTNAYVDRGWAEWPLIMMDTTNHPLLPEQHYAIGLAWLEEATAPMAKAGFEYQRYLVGGTPPEGELRPSTLEADDARNGLALATGALGFIIESGIQRDAEDPQADIGRRVAAYLELLDRFLHDRPFRDRTVAAVEVARAQRLPAFLPVNTFWGRIGPPSAMVAVVEAAAGTVVRVPAPNLMTDRVVKRAVPAPAGYVIDGSAAEVLRVVLARHGVRYEVLPLESDRVVQHCELERVEDGFDEVYSRYEGRQIVSCSAPSDQRFAPGALEVRLDQPAWRPAVAVLEPLQLYGLYQHEELRAVVAEDGTLPVYRVVE